MGVINPGDKVHIITRRLFECDLRRHFVGVVDEVHGMVARVRGYAFLFDHSINDFVRREDERARVFCLSDVGLIVNILPHEAVLSEVRYVTDAQGRRYVTDGRSFRLNVDEFGPAR
jgi:hypothetical protein